jgi:uncharacterized protein (TIGR03435 family)
MRRAIFSSGYFLFTWCAFGQTDQIPFDAASLKQSGPQSIRGSEGGPGSRDPGRFTFGSAALRELLGRAYGVVDYQQQVAGPGWIDTEKYDIAVTMPPSTTKLQFQRMLQSLLAERFKLVLHHETKMLPVYELVIAKTGPKLKESVGTTAAIGASAKKPASDHDEDGFPILPAGLPGLVQSVGPGQTSHWTARQETMSVFATMLSGATAAGRTVIDKTGLGGKYDFHLYYDMRLPGTAAGADDSPAPILFDALEQQLGLKLADAKAPFDVVVVDHAEKVPAEN